MGNMSYCRFENTLGDLQDCAEHVTDTNLSESEARARVALIGVCADILESVGVDFSGSVASKELDAALEDLREEDG